MGGRELKMLERGRGDDEEELHKVGQALEESPFQLTSTLE